MIPFHFASDPSAHGEGIAVPAGLSTKAELFSFLARAIPLPDYFGHNWDALEECLTDLGSLVNPHLALVHHDIPLEGHPAEQRTYLEILTAAAQDSDRLHITFPEKDRPQIEHLLSPQGAS